MLTLLSVLALAGLAVVGGAVYFVGSPEFEQLAADYTVRLIEERTGARVSLEAFDLDFWGQNLTFEGLVLRGEESEAEAPLVAVGRIGIGFRLRSLLGRRIDLWRLTIEDPEIFLRIGEGGETNLPSPPPADPDRGGSPIPFEIAIGDFVLSRGDLRINESRVDLEFALADVEGLFDFDEVSRVLSGHLAYTGQIDGVGAGVIPYRMDADFDYLRGEVRLRPAVLTSGQTTLRLEGEVEDFLGSRSGTLDYDGVVDLPFLNHFLTETEFEGASQVDGSLRFTTREFATEGHARSSRLRVDQWVAADFDTDYTYSFPERRVVATGLRTGFGGGNAGGTVTISPLPGSPTLEMDLDYQDIDPLSFGELFPWGVDYVTHSRADGSIRGWFLGGFDDFELEGDLAMQDMGGDSPSAAGSTGFVARPGEVEVRGLAATFGQATVRADGRIGADILDLMAELDSRDLAELDFLYPGLDGRGSFDGRIWGSLGAPVFDGDFGGDLGGTRIEARGRIGPDQLDLDATLASQDLRDMAFLYDGPQIPGGGRFSGRVTGTMSEPALDGDFAVSLDRTRIEATGRLSAAGMDLDADLDSEDLGDLAFVYADANGSGKVRGRVAGSFTEPEFAGDVALSGLAWREWRFDRIDGGVMLAGNSLELQDLRVLSGDSDVVIGGTYRLDGSSTDLEVGLNRLEARELEPFVSAPLDGAISGQVHVGALQPMDLMGRVEARDLAYDGHPIGRVTTTVSLAADEVTFSDLRIIGEDSTAQGDALYGRESGRVEAQLQFSGQRLEDYHWVGIPESISGHVTSGDLSVNGPRETPQISGQFLLSDFAFGGKSFTELSIDARTDGSVLTASITSGPGLSLETRVELSEDARPFQGETRFTSFDAGELAGLEPGGIIASGTASFRGTLDDLTSLTGEGRMDALSASVGERTLDVSQPFQFGFTSREVRVESLQLVGAAGTMLRLDGTIAIEPEAPLDLYVDGQIDLALLGSQYDNLDLSGLVDLGAAVEGTASDPLLVGVATLNDVSLGHSDVFLGLSELRGDIFLDGSRATLNRIRGTMGGGSVEINGTVGLGGAARAAMDLGIDVENVRPRRLRGLRTNFDGSLALRGNLDALVLDGNIQLQSLAFSESFDQFLQLFDRGPEAPPEEGLPDSLALAVHVEGNRDIRVENELVGLEGRLDLDVGGTLGRPSLTGHSEISRGTLTLQGRRYRITRGNVDFVDPVSIDPRVDIQAEADIRDYRVILLFTGQGENIRMTMRSDPALPEIEIVSLIAGGRTLSELDEDARKGGADEETLFQGAASSILAEMLQSRVGSRLGVLNSVRIDPFRVGAEGRPVTRLTVSEQITGDIEITYSQDLSSNKQQVIQIEYFLNPDTSFIASRDELGRLGLDIKLRKRFD